MNLASVELPNLGSGNTSRLATTRLLGMLVSYLFRVPDHCPGRIGLTVTTVTSRWMPYQAPALLLGSLGSVLGSALLTIRYARSIEAAANGVVTNPRQVLYTTAPDQHHAVLLQVMALTTNVRGHLKTVGQPDTADFSQRRVRLLRSCGVHPRTDAATLRARL